MTIFKPNNFTANFSKIEDQFSELVADIRGLFKHECDTENEAVEIVRGQTVNQIFDELGAAGKTRHGFSNSNDPRRKALYECWHNIRMRCNNPNHPKYPDYGLRGIECRFKSFEEFARHVEFRPAGNFSIDRIDNDGNYEAGNVKWSTDVEQANNRRAPRRRSVKSN